MRQKRTAYSFDNQIDCSVHVQANYTKNEAVARGDLAFAPRLQLEKKILPLRDSCRSLALRPDSSRFGGQ